jgi:cysteate synthase
MLKCLGCGRVHPDSFQLSCCPDALLVSDYPARISLGEQPYPGIWRFLDWLPARVPYPAETRGVTYRSEGFGPRIGLENLWVSFNGYWPERGALSHTCSFKELEAVPTLARARETGQRGLVLASAGNTARAFAYHCGAAGMPLVILVAEIHLHRLWLPRGHSPGPVVLVGIQQADYGDAIELVPQVAERIGFTPEGGVRNVARRDGIGTLFLDAVATMGTMPRHYFQAVGSGVGAVACWEAAVRLRDTGQFGSELPCLHLAQDPTYAPMLWAWQGKREKLDPCLDLRDGHASAEGMYTDILYNRRPAYSIKGGVRDCVLASCGNFYGVTPQMAQEAKEQFEAAEGIDIAPPAAVAVGALIQAVQQGCIAPDEPVLLNITGGGEERLAKEVGCELIPPQAITTRAQVVDKVADLVQELSSL